MLTYKYYDVMTDVDLFKVTRVFVDIFYRSSSSTASSTASSSASSSASSAVLLVVVLVVVLVVQYC